MNKQRLLTMAALAGLTLGGFAVSAASAQTADPAETTDSVTEQNLTEDSTTEDSITEDSVTEDSADADADAGGESEGHERNGRNGRGGCGLDGAAEAIGIDEAELDAALEAGDTIADVATANGVDVDTVIDALVADKAENIAEKVTEGRITQDEADEKLAELATRISDKVNGVE